MSAMQSAMKEAAMGAVMVDSLRRKAEDAKRQADRLQKMVELATELGDEGLSELLTLLSPPDADEANGRGNGNGHAGSATNGKRAYGNRYTAETPHIPRGREAVRRVVRDRPGIWSLEEIRAEFRARGWLDSLSGAEVAARRLCDENGEGRRIGIGRYVFPANYGELPEPDEMEGTGESDASGAAMIAST